MAIRIESRYRYINKWDEIQSCYFPWAQERIVLKPKAQLPEGHAAGRQRSSSPRLSSWPLAPPRLGALNPHSRHDGAQITPASERAEKLSQTASYPSFTETSVLVPESSSSPTSSGCATSSLLLPPSLRPSLPRPAHRLVLQAVLFLPACRRGSIVAQAQASPSGHGLADEDPRRHDARRGVPLVRLGRQVWTRRTRTGTDGTRCQGCL